MTSVEVNSSLLKWEQIYNSSLLSIISLFLLDALRQYTGRDQV